MGRLISDIAEDIVGLRIQHFFPRLERGVLFPRLEMEELFCRFEHNPYGD